MIIYKTTNLINNKIYIGKQVTIRKTDTYLGSGKLLRLSLKKYGRDNFKKEILQECNSLEELNERERYWIKELNSIIPNGYNICLGGEGGDTISNNPNKKDIIEKQKNTIKLNGKNKGINNHMFGKHQSDEAKRKTSEKVKELYKLGKIERYRMTDEGKKKISIYMTENCPTKTPEGRIKNHLNNLGVKNPNANVYEFLSPDGIKFEVIGNIKNFCKEHNLHYRKIIKVHRGIIDNCNGWKCNKICKNNYWK